MDTLDQLICQTARESIEGGTEAITEEALNNMLADRNDLNNDRHRAHTSRCSSRISLSDPVFRRVGQRNPAGVLTPV
ncbi:hypothetical protein [Streptomyces violascens]|uniref:hypothetical protein n=1 Tax=Streptomyces violascens TaxID=67381 RepID=UPI001CFF0C87|nr:hypothetical protein [Streptomyces violascens]